MTNAEISQLEGLFVKSPLHPEDILTICKAARILTMAHREFEEDIRREKLKVQMLRAAQRLCPDCRDKVPANECPRCRWQALEKERDRLRAALTDILAHADVSSDCETEWERAVARGRDALK